MEEEHTEEAPVEEPTVEEAPEEELEESTEELPEEETPSEPEDKKQPLIPRKAYDSEKGKRQAFQTENEQLKARLAELEKAQPKQDPKPPATVEEAFDQNPAGTLSYIDSEIRKARAEYDQDRVTELVDLKATLATRAMLNMEGKHSAAAQRTKIESEIYKAVPDFDTKRAELIQAAKESGVSEKVAADMINPDIVGDVAVDMIKMLSKVHTMLNAGKTARAKEVKTAPKTEPAGNGGFSNNNQTQKQFTKAKESGRIDDWAVLLG